MANRNSANLFIDVCDAYMPEWLRISSGGHQTDPKERIRNVLPFVIDACNNAKMGTRTCDRLWAMLEEPSLELKDALLSMQHRRFGDELAEKGDLAEALVVLNQAVMRGPPKGYDLKSDGGMQLALALWSRSGVLLMRGNGQRALSDLLYAVKCGLSAKQDAAYYLRQFWAHAMSGDKDKALVCLALCERMCNDSEVLQGLAKHRTNIDMIVCQPNKNMSKEPLLTNGSHSLLTGASSLLEVRSATGPAGRHVIAGQPIGAGDTLLVEQPLVACLQSECHDTHCLHCMRSLGAPVAVPYGCDTCSMVAFCSPDCQRIACSTYHRYECRFGDLLIDAGMPLQFSGIRIPLRSVTQCSSVEEALRRGRQMVSELCDHESQRSPRDKLHNIVMAAFLMCLLQKSGFFGAERSNVWGNQGTEFDSDELQVAAVLLGLIDRQQYNLHGIDEVHLGRGHWMDLNHVIIGVGLYKTGALFNHDCNASANKLFVGRTLVLTAIRPLRTGEPVTVSYGPTFIQTTRKVRQLVLRTKYMFRCECRCCLEDWPMLVHMDDKMKLRCPTANCAAVHTFPTISGKPEVNCRMCRKLVSLQYSVQQVGQSVQQYNSAIFSLMSNQTRDAVQPLAMAIDQFYAVAVAPHLQTIFVENSMAACLALKGTVAA